MITDYLKAGYSSNLPESGRKLKSGKKRDNIEPSPIAFWGLSSATRIGSGGFYVSTKSGLVQLIEVTICDLKN